MPHTIHSPASSVECSTATGPAPRDLLTPEADGRPPLLVALRSMGSSAETVAAMSLLLTGARSGELSGAELESILTARASHGMTPLHLLANGEAPAKLRALIDTVRTLEREKHLRPGFIQTLLRREATPSASAHAGQPAFQCAAFGESCSELPELLEILADIVDRGDLPPHEVAPLLLGHPGERPGPLLDTLMMWPRPVIDHAFNGLRQALRLRLLTGSEIAAALSPTPVSPAGDAGGPGRRRAWQAPDPLADPLRHALFCRGSWLATPITKFLADALRSGDMTTRDVMCVLDRTAAQGGPLATELPHSDDAASPVKALSDYHRGLDDLRSAGLSVTERQRLLSGQH